MSILGQLAKEFAQLRGGFLDRSKDEMPSANVHRLLQELAAGLERRRAEGKTFKEAMRCLKRHLCNVVYRQMISDWRAMQSV